MLCEDRAMNRQKRYSPEFPERAIRLVEEQQKEGSSRASLEPGNRLSATDRANQYPPFRQQARYSLSLQPESGGCGFSVDGQARAPV